MFKHFSHIFSLLFLSILIFSCSKDEFAKIKIVANPYDSVEINDAIIVKNIEVSEYFLNSNGTDTTSVKFYIDYELNEDYFLNNDISTPKFEVKVEAWVNNIRFVPRTDQGQTRFYIKEQYKYFKNINNIIEYKFLLFKDPNDFNKRKSVSNEYSFRVN